jgi:hypothetical protein
MLYVAALSMALAQSTGTADGVEDSLGSERARLANQRIQAEAEMRAREEQRRLEEEAQAKLRAQQAAARSEMAAAQDSEQETAELASGEDMSRTLQQLRLLGELKDDGYVSEEEFQRIKQRILDDRL